LGPAATRRSFQLAQTLDMLPHLRESLVTLLGRYSMQAARPDLCCNNAPPKGAERVSRWCKTIASMWKPAETAPFDEDVTVLVSDGCRSPYVLLKPCQRTKAVWVVSGKKTPLAVVPLKWMPFQRVSMRQRHRRAVATLGGG
jgi:hypothetical protein